MISAMTETIVVLTVVLVLAALLVTLREILRDGYGHTDLPRRFTDSDWSGSYRTR